MVCLGNICINTLHKRAKDEDDDDGNNNLYSNFSLWCLTFIRFGFVGFFTILLCLVIVILSAVLG
jgi:hypothetical protein